MQRVELLKLAERVLRLPTAPYHEHAVQAFVIEHCRALGVRVECDRVGNVIARYGHSGKPLVLMAHMDHPGFEALGGNRAEFLGGVQPAWFKGSPVRMYTAGGVVRAKVTGVNSKHWPRRKLVNLNVESGVLRPGDFGMWDVPAFRVRAGKLHATAIDDVLSVAVVLATLTEVSRRKLKTQVWGAFTRAEEVGFNGAVEMARDGRIPHGALVISMEMSRERPWARIGNGPVIRVGDLMTIFDGRATHFLSEVARRSAIRAQRCLMDGGTTEATAFGGYGYRVGGLCLALGNYHNMGTNNAIRSEYVSISDLEGLVRLTVAAARRWLDFHTINRRLRQRVDQIRATAPRELKF